MSDNVDSNKIWIDWTLLSKIGRNGEYAISISKIMFHYEQLNINL